MDNGDYKKSLGTTKYNVLKEKIEDLADNLGSLTRTTWKNYKHHHSQHEKIEADLEKYKQNLDRMAMVQLIWSAFNTIIILCLAILLI